MFRSVLAHVSLLAVLVHLHGDCCAMHFPGCESHAAESLAAGSPDAGHGEHHGDHRLPASPADEPSHDDCHDSHAAAAMSQAVKAPAPQASGCWVLSLAAKSAAGSTRAHCLAATERRSCSCPLALRADLRSQALLN